MLSFVLKCCRDQPNPTQHNPAQGEGEAHSQGGAAGEARLEVQSTFLAQRAFRGTIDLLKVPPHAQEAHSLEKGRGRARGKQGQAPGECRRAMCEH